MRFFGAVIIFIVLSYPASGQRMFDSAQTIKILKSLPQPASIVSVDKDFIRSIEVIDKKYREISDSIYSYKSRQLTIFETVLIETNDSVFINPLSLGGSLHTESILFYYRTLNDKADSIARHLKRQEKKKLFHYLEASFDHYSAHEKKLKARPVRIRYIKFFNANIIHAGIDIYGTHFRWTIDKTKNWAVTEVESLWVY